MANIHSAMLLDCRQLHYVGTIGDDLSNHGFLDGTSDTEKKKNNSSGEIDSSQNLPFSKLIMIDRIRSKLVVQILYYKM